MALPTLTPEQRQNALDKAKQSRQDRAAFKARLARGEISPEQGLDEALDTEVLAKLKPAAFLTALPGWGKVRAAKFTESVGLSSGRTLKGLGNRQLAELREAISA